MMVNKLDQQERRRGLLTFQNVEFIQEQDHLGVFQEFVTNEVLP